MNPTRYIAAAAAVLFASALPAQLAKGSVAPAFEIQKAWNDGPTKFDELDGKLVILDFAQTWWGPCKAAVPHLNSLYEKYRDRGLLLIGVSDENEKLIEETFITKLGAKYPFVTAKGVNELYAISFFPSIYCIAPDGTVLTVPKDREPAESFIEEQLKNVVLGPKLPADAKYDALRSMWAKKEHKKLQDFLTKTLAQPNLDDASKAVYEAQQADLANRIERQSARVPELGKGPDYGSAEKALEKMQKEWAGLPPADAAKAELERFAKDERIQDELAAQKALDKVVGKFDPTKLAQRRKLAEELDKFANTKKWSGTQAAQKAATMRDEMAGK